MILGIAISLSFISALAHGKFIMIWLSINFVQLSAYMPLIAKKVPATAHFFFYNILSTVRLSFEGIGSYVDDLESKMREFELISSGSFT